MKRLIRVAGIVTIVLTAVATGQSVGSASHPPSFAAVKQKCRYQAEVRQTLCYGFWAILGVGIDSTDHVYVLENDAFEKVGNRTFVNKLSSSGTLIARWNKVLGIYDADQLVTDTQGNVYLLGVDGLVKLSPQGKRLGHWHLWQDIKAHYYYSTYGVDAHGIIYMVDTGWGRRVYHVARISAASHRLKLLSEWTFPQSDPTGRGVAHIAVDPTRCVYVNDNVQIYKFSFTGRLLATWGKRAALARSEGFGQMTTDRQGNVYVQGLLPGLTAYDSIRIHKLSPEGKHLRLYQSGPGVSLEFFKVDSKGNIFGADQHFVYKLSPNSRLLAKWG